MKKVMNLVLVLGVILIVGCKSNEVIVQPKTELERRGEVKDDANEKGKEEVENLSIKLDYTLTAEEFISKYKPEDIKTEEDKSYYTYITNLEYNDGLAVSIYHDKKDYKTNKISSLLIKSNKYSIDGLKIGMGLKEAYEYCNENYDKFYNHHYDQYEEKIFNLPNSNMTIRFNDIGFEKYEVKNNDIVESISLMEILD